MIGSFTFQARKRTADAYQDQPHRAYEQQAHMHAFTSGQLCCQRKSNVLQSLPILPEAYQAHLAIQPGPQ